MPIQQDQRYYLKLKALYYLYEKNYTQTDIAKLLGVSRVTLGKLLDEAKREGMVKIDRFLKMPAGRPANCGPSAAGRSWKGGAKRTLLRRGRGG